MNISMIWYQFLDSKQTFYYPFLKCKIRNFSSSWQNDLQLPIYFGTKCEFFFLVFEASVNLALVNLNHVISWIYFCNNPLLCQELFPCSFQVHTHFFLFTQMIPPTPLHIEGWKYLQRIQFFFFFGDFGGDLYIGQTRVSMGGFPGGLRQ